MCLLTFPLLGQGVWRTKQEGRNEKGPGLRKRQRSLTSHHHWQNRFYLGKKELHLLPIKINIQLVLWVEGNKKTTLKHLFFPFSQAQFHSRLHLLLSCAGAQWLQSVHSSSSLPLIPKHNFLLLQHGLSMGSSVNICLGMEYSLLHL